MWLCQAKDHLQRARPHQTVVEMFASAEEAEGLGQEAEHHIVTARGEGEKGLDESVVSGVQESL